MCDPVTFDTAFRFGQNSKSTKVLLDISWKNTFSGFEQAKIPFKNIIWLD